MNANEVIEAGRYANEIQFSILPFGAIFFTITCGVILLLLQASRWNPKFRIGIGIVFGVYLVFIIIAAVQDREKQILNWRKDVADGYIERKIEQTAKLVEYEVLDDAKEGYYTKNWYPQKQKSVAIKMEHEGVTYKLKGTYEVFEAHGDEEGTVTFQMVPQDLGNGLDKQFYNVRVYVSKGEKE